MDLFRQNSATREDLGMLAVMDALAAKDQVTQRELSRQTGLNLKKVHFCLHKLLEKGYVKFQRALHNPDKRAYLYILTPAGLRAKSELTYRFLKFTLAFYNQVEAKVQETLAAMEKAGIARVVLYGASDAARMVQEQTRANRIEVVGVIDEHYQDKEFSGLPLLKAADLQQGEWDGVLITALENLDKAERYLEEAGVAATKVWKLS
ncbi:MAG: helix-turn-helix domain-containing protein [Candidatus Latescibacteria bacterium]|nr:helix-turn-helix domain-containing protein [Candidatus Latescibacterota bacterium]